MRIEVNILRRTGLVVVACTTGIAAPSHAQSNTQFTVPAGCEAFLTVQSRSCSVAHYWNCSADPEGTFWRVAIDQDGPYYLSQSDAEYRWLQNYELASGAEAVLIEPEEDPASISELLETGTDSMVFSMQRTEAGVSFQRDYNGFDSLTGAEIEIDGQRLLLTEFTYSFETEAGTLLVTGNQFVDPERRLFFGGLETSQLGDNPVVEADYSPREFIVPGEDGFLSTRPLYDCGDTMSSLSPLPGLELGRHDTHQSEILGRIISVSR